MQWSGLLGLSGRAQWVAWLGGLKGQSEKVSEMPLQGGGRQESGGLELARDCPGLGGGVPVGASTSAAVSALREPWGSWTLLCLPPESSG